MDIIISFQVILKTFLLLAMEALDCDKGLLRSGNMVAARDIVQVLLKFNDSVFVVGGGGVTS